MRSRRPAHLVSRVGQGDKILISADRNPNVRGALVTGLINGVARRRSSPSLRRGDRCRRR